MGDIRSSKRIHAAASDKAADNAAKRSRLEEVMDEESLMAGGAGGAGEAGGEGGAGGAGEAGGEGGAGEAGGEGGAGEADGEGGAVGEDEEDSEDDEEPKDMTHYEKWTAQSAELLQKADGRYMKTMTAIDPLGFDCLSHPFEGNLEVNSITAKDVYDLYIEYEKRSNEIPLDANYEKMMNLNKATEYQLPKHLMDLLRATAHHEHTSYLVQVDVGLEVIFGKLAKLFHGAGLTFVTQTKTAAGQTECALSSGICQVNAALPEGLIGLRAQIDETQMLPLEFVTTFKKVLLHLKTANFAEKPMLIVVGPIAQLECSLEFKKRRTDNADALQKAYRLLQLLAPFFVKPGMPQSLFSLFGLPSFTNQAKVVQLIERLALPLQTYYGSIGARFFTKPFERTLNSKKERVLDNARQGRLPSQPELLKGISKTMPNAEPLMNEEIVKAILSFVQSGRKQVFEIRVSQLAETLNDFKEKLGKGEFAHKKRAHDLIVRVQGSIKSQNYQLDALFEIMKGPFEKLDAICLKLPNDAPRKIHVDWAEIVKQCSKPLTSERVREFLAKPNAFSFLGRDARTIFITIDDYKIMLSDDLQHPMYNAYKTLEAETPKNVDELVILVADLLAGVWIKSLEEPNSNDKRTDLMDKYISNHLLIGKGLRPSINGPNVPNKRDLAKFTTFFNHYSQGLRSIAREGFTACKDNFVMALICALQNPVAVRDQVHIRLTTALGDYRAKFHEVATNMADGPEVELHLKNVHFLFNDMVKHGLMFLELKMIEYLMKNGMQVFNEPLLFNCMLLKFRDSMDSLKKVSNPREVLEKFPALLEHSSKAMSLCAAFPVSATSDEGVTSHFFLTKHGLFESTGCQSVGSVSKLARMNTPRSVFAKTDVLAEGAASAMFFKNYYQPHVVHLCVTAADYVKNHFAVAALYSLFYNIDDLKKFISATPDSVLAILAWAGTPVSHMEDSGYLNMLLLDIDWVPRERLAAQAGVKSREITSRMGLFQGFDDDKEKKFLTVIVLALCAGSPNAQAMKEITGKFREKEAERVQEAGVPSSVQKLFSAPVSKLFTWNAGVLKPVPGAVFGNWEDICIVPPKNARFAKSAAP